MVVFDASILKTRIACGEENVIVVASTDVQTKQVFLSLVESPLRNSFNEANIPAVIRIQQR